jgi:hypothetical protein
MKLAVASSKRWRKAARNSSPKMAEAQVCDYESIGA